MNELKGRYGLKQENLIHFHRASLDTDFPFMRPQALSTNLRDYLTSAGRSWGLPLFSNLQLWSGYYVSGVLVLKADELRELLRS